MRAQLPLPHCAKAATRFSREIDRETRLLALPYAEIQTRHSGLQRLVQSNPEATLTRGARQPSCDPATVGISAPRRVHDLSGGGSRTLRDPLGVHGVFVNGVRVFDGTDYARLDKGPGQVLDRFLPARALRLRLRVHE
jgi:hypothetical protein